MGLASIMIVGDSKAITDCVRGVTTLHSLLLENWMGDVRKLISKSSHITFKHIFRELNDETDRLSKKGIDELDGNISFKKFRDEMPVQSNRLKFFWFKSCSFSKLCLLIACVLGMAYFLFCYHYYDMFFIIRGTKMSK